MEKFDPRLGHLAKNCCPKHHSPKYGQKKFYNIGPMFFGKIGNRTYGHKGDGVNLCTRASCASLRLSSGWTQTLDLKMMCQVFYHCATTAGQIWRLICLKTLNLAKKYTCLYDDLTEIWWASGTSIMKTQTLVIYRRGLWTCNLCFHKPQIACLNITAIDI